MFEVPFDGDEILNIVAQELNLNLEAFSTYQKQTTRNILDLKLEEAIDEAAEKAAADAQQGYEDEVGEAEEEARSEGYSNALEDVQDKFSSELSSLDVDSLLSSLTDDQKEALKALLRDICYSLYF